MPLASQAAFSSSSIGREASEMSVSPSQNFSKPPPVPEVPTVTWTPGCSSWKSSAAAVVSGATVLEPSILTLATELLLAAAAGVAGIRAVVAPATGGQCQRGHGQQDAEAPYGDGHDAMPLLLPGVVYIDDHLRTG